MEWSKARVLSGGSSHSPGIARRISRRLLNASVSQDLSVDTLVHDWILRSDERSFPVVDGTRLVGLVCLEDVRTLPREAWAATPVRVIMTPASNFLLYPLERTRLPPLRSCSAAIYINCRFWRASEWSACCAVAT